MRVVILFCMAAGMHAAAQDRPSIRGFPVATIAALGRAIYQQDQAGWRAMDIMLAQGLELPDHRLRGWITTEDARGLLVSAATIA